ncbi:MAG TPA: response regulator [Thermoanaerobaculia bacterium]|jgi:CheY-like chemotaxis protein
MKRRILLADDSVTIQKVIELTFMDEDYEVRAVSNGDEAVALLSELNPDFVIADVHMPGANGYEVCRRTKQLKPGIPVLLLVGTFEPFDEAQARAVGADSFLKKPFDSQELLQRVEELIAAKGPAAAAAPAAAAPAAAANWAATPETDWAATPLPVAPVEDWMATPAAPHLAGAEPAHELTGTGPIPEFPAEPAWGSFELEPEPAPPAPLTAHAAHAAPAAPEPFDREPAFSLEPDPAYGQGTGKARDVEPEPVFTLDEGEPSFAVREDVFSAPSELSLDETPQDRYLADEPAAPAATPAAGFDWSASPEPEPEPERLYIETPAVPAWQTPPPEPELRWSETEPFVAVPADPPLPPAVGAPEALAAPEAPEPAFPPGPTQPVYEPAPVAAAHAGGNGRLSDDDVDRIARRVVELLGDKTIRDVAWEVIPDLAEVIIRDRLRELEAQVE